MADVGLKIVVGADLSAVNSAMKVAANNVAQFGEIAETAFAEVAANVNKAAGSFDHMAAGKAALDRITASIDAAADAATKAGPKFDSLGGRLPLQDFNKFKSTFDRFKRDIETGFKFNFPPIPAIPPAVPASFDKTKSGANQAAAALTNVGRVAQDLPFGFIGIQNNLNPLLESFQRLKAETGSGKAALSALGQSLIGPAGIGIALSVVSSAIVIFQNGIAGFNKKSKEAKESADELAKSIRSISLIAQESTAGVEGQLSQVSALAAAVADSNRPYAERKRALEELKEVNKAYFEDLKLEDAATGKLTATVQEYTKALINNAIQKGFVDEIASVAKAVAKQDDVIAKSRLKLAQAQKAVADAENFLPSGTRDIETARAQKREQAGRKEAEALKELQAENAKVTELLTQEALIREQLNKAVAEGLKFKDLDAGKGKKEEDFLKKQLDLLEKIRDAAKEVQGNLFDLAEIDAATDRLAALEQQVGDLKLQIAVRDAKKAGMPAAEIEKLKDAIKQDTQKRLNEAFEKEALLLEFKNLKLSPIERLDVNEIASKVFTNKEKIILALGENGIDVRMKKEAVDITDLQGKIAKAMGLDKKIPVITLHEARVLVNGEKITAQIEGKEQILADLNRQVAAIFEGGLNDGFAAIGEGFGEALATGDFGEGLKKAAQNILGILGDVMQQIGKAVIAAAIKIELLKKTLETWAFKNPALAIVAGVGLIAAGAALKNIQFDGPKFAEGGIVSAPMIGQVGERFRPEVILPLDRLPQLFKQFGGDMSGGTQLIPIINNEGLYLAMKRGERSAGRKF